MIFGYKLHTEAHYLLSDNWGNSTTGIGGSGFCYENQYGSLQDMENDDCTVVPVRPIQGKRHGPELSGTGNQYHGLQNGTTWVHTYQDRTGTYTDSSPHDSHQVSVWQRNLYSKPIPPLKSKPLIFLAMKMQSSLEFPSYANMHLNRQTIHFNPQFPYFNSITSLFLYILVYYS